MSDIEPITSETCTVFLAADGSRWLEASQAQRHNDRFAARASEAARPWREQLSRQAQEWLAGAGRSPLADFEVKVGGLTFADLRRNQALAGRTNDRDFAGLPPGHLLFAGTDWDDDGPTLLRFVASSTPWNSDLFRRRADANSLLYPPANLDDLAP